MSEQARAPGAAWPWLIGAILLGSVVVNGAMVVAASGDPSFVIEADYYEKAVAWDTRLARAEQSRALGWTARLEVDGAAGARRVTLHLTDVGGAEVRGAAARLRMFHRARATEVTELVLTASDDGYTGSAPLVRPGLWQVEIEARRGASHFVTEQTVELDASAGVR